MSSYTQEQIKDLWDFFDEDKSGKIPCAELKNLFVKLGSDSETAVMKGGNSHSETPLNESRGKLHVHGLRTNPHLFVQVNNMNKTMQKEN